MGKRQPFTARRRSLKRPTHFPQVAVFHHLLLCSNRLFGTLHKCRPCLFLLGITDPTVLGQLVALFQLSRLAGYHFVVAVTILGRALNGIFRYAHRITGGIFEWCTNRTKQGFFRPSRGSNFPAIALLLPFCLHRRLSVRLACPASRVGRATGTSLIYRMLRRH